MYLYLPSGYILVYDVVYFFPRMIVPLSFCNNGSYICRQIQYILFQKMYFNR